MFVSVELILCFFNLRLERVLVDVLREVVGVVLCFGVDFFNLLLWENDMYILR